jgi:predicted nucleic acid-binding Zn ribbon protein
VKRGFDDLGSVLEGLLGELHLDVRVRQHQVWGMWDELVGEGIAGKAQPDRVRGKTLFVNVANSAWMQELQFMRRMIIDRINKALGAELIDSIQFRIGTVSGRAEKVQSRKAEDHVPLPPDIVEEIDRCVQEIKDEEVRERMRRVLAKQARLSLTVEDERGA